ncbi:MAG: hypothetical protein WA705_28130 [Candidatus Ozemobacteraceae bacterium]
MNGMNPYPARHSRRGIALFATVLMLVLLVALFLRIDDEMLLQNRMDRRQNQAFQARMGARSGIAAGLALLYNDRNPVDHLLEPWAVMSSATMEAPMRIGDATTTFRVTDEFGKLNVNLIDEKTLVAVLEEAKLGISERSSLLGEDIDIQGPQRLAHRILDYIDRDEEARPFGGEFEGYERAPGKKAKNGPLQDIRELSNIPGIRPDLLTASDTRPGLFDLLTIYGDGPINLNTARHEVIRGIPGPPGYSYDKREKFFEALFKILPITANTNLRDFISRYDYHISKEYYLRFVVYSTCFRIESIAKVDEVESRMVALVRRDRFGRCWLDRLSELP